HPINALGDASLRGGQRGAVWMLPQRYFVRLCGCDRSDRSDQRGAFVAFRALVAAANYLQIPIHGRAFEVANQISARRPAVSLCSNLARRRVSNRRKAAPIRSTD